MQISVVVTGIIKDALNTINIQIIIYSSGCRISGPALTQFTSSCPCLKPEDVAYCSLIEDGPDPLAASGCHNMDCELRACCSNYQN